MVRVGHRHPPERATDARSAGMTAGRVFRAADRSVGRRPGVHTFRTFSFGDFYDPAATGVGPMVALNDESIEPGAGYGDHRHAGVDVVTWVTSGVVAHRDRVAAERLLAAGSASVLRSGRGTTHSETCSESSGSPARMVQMWLVTGRAHEPSYASVDLSGPLAGGRLVAVGAGPGEVRAPLELSVPGAVLRAGRLPAGGGFRVVAGPLGLAHVVSGSLELSATRLGCGDTMALDVGGWGVAGPGGAEVLVWELPPP